MAEWVMWNAWHGCHKVSTGCKNCYMFSMDNFRDIDPENIHRNSTYKLPLKEDKGGFYKYPEGTHFMVNLTSDTFLEDAEKWISDLWYCIKERDDCVFHIITKRPERIKQSLPMYWDDLYNVDIGITCENQEMADKRFEYVKDLNLKHLSIYASPLLEYIDFSKWFENLRIDEVSVSGERDYNARACNFDWVKKMQQDCFYHEVNFKFFETGTKFICDGKQYYISKKSVQEEQARKAAMDLWFYDIEYRRAYYA